MTDENTTENPSVCVIITCYNYAQYVKRAINSVFAQTYDNLSLLIINDGSTDNSSEVINAAIAGHENVYFMDNQQNSGVSKTFNMGRNYVIDKNFDYSIMLDADNEFYPDHVEKLVQHAQDEKADVVYVNFDYINESGEVTRRVHFPDYVPNLLKIGNYIDLSILVKTDLLKKVQYDENMKTYQDWDLMVQLEEAEAKFYRAEDCFLRYFYHEDGNNQKIDTNEGLAEHFRLLRYIIDKLPEHPGTPFNWAYGVGERFITLFNHSNNQQKHIEELESVNAYINAIIKHRDEELAAHKQRIAALENSSSYRLGQALTKPLRGFKKLTRKAGGGEDVD